MIAREQQNHKQMTVVSMQKRKSIILKEGNSVSVLFFVIWNLAGFVAYRLTNLEAIFPKRPVKTFFHLSYYLYLSGGLEPNFLDSDDIT